MVTLLCVCPGAIGLQARKLAPFTTNTDKGSNLELMSLSTCPKFTRMWANLSWSI
jgi:hypothetical protein